MKNIFRQISIITHTIEWNLQFTFFDLKYPRGIIFAYFFSMTVCFYHVTYAFQNESSFYSCLIYFPQVRKIQHFFFLSFSFFYLLIEIVGQLTTFNTDKVENRLTYFGLNFWVVGKNISDNIFQPTLCTSFHPIKLLPRSLDDL